MYLRYLHFKHMSKCMCVYIYCTACIIDVVADDIFCDYATCSFVRHIQVLFCISRGLANITSYKLKRAFVSYALNFTVYPKSCSSKTDTAESRRAK